MPQSSILAWLGGNSVISPQPKEAELKSQVEQQDQDALPTPPPSSPGYQSNGKVLKAEAKETSSSTKSWQTGSHKTSLPPNVSFRPCNQKDIPQLKRLHTLLFPLPYSNAFFRETHQDPIINNLTILAFWSDHPTPTKTDNARLIGTIRCRILDSSSASKEGPMLYLSTLALLSPYRSHGIAAHMLDVATKRAVEYHGVTSVGAHVWEANVEALEWYRKRGFREVGREQGYYRRLKPQGAVVVQRRIGVMDLVGD